ncbi:glycosyl transferase family A [Scytonema hofmannii PCC 7110]|uniref:Glycosyl transferase family A n=1 Tax=Scytonema hofmannii PCC 7110 TaxID=128403 RepID=A0A139WQ35_9CYAN|nr:glycosyltransferase family A protein [Scytonema hofmannii]KYC34537.1 glycosyl transferase family A [Scytonema hofmannii PCC 7110]
MKLSIITATYNRPEQLNAIALPSLLDQTDYNFEWVVVNDGGNPEIREIVSHLKTNFSLKYVEIKHSSTGFGLCHARNAGLEAATGELISYLDDDNNLTPKFIATTSEFFRQYPTVKYCMTAQQRRRDVTKDGKIIRQGKTFLSPSHAECSLAELISQKEIFDSNGFTHYWKNAPKWNSNYRVFADYEYLLQCINVWGRQGFQINSIPLVNYIQSSEGIIGSSSYQEWAEELSRLIENTNLSLIPNEVEKLHQLVSVYQEKCDSQLPAFI